MTLGNKLIRFLLNDQENTEKCKVLLGKEVSQAWSAARHGISPPESRAMLFVLSLGTVWAARLPTPAVRRPTQNSGEEATETSRKGSEVVAAEHVP